MTIDLDYLRADIKTKEGREKINREISDVKNIEENKIKAMILVPLLIEKIDELDKE